MQSSEDFFIDVVSHLAAYRVFDASKIIISQGFSDQLRQACCKLTEVMERKQHEAGRLAQLSCFYRTCIEKIVEGKQLSQDLMENEFGEVSSTCKQIVLDLEAHLNSIITHLNTVSDEATELKKTVNDLLQRQDDEARKQEEVRLRTQAAFQQVEKKHEDQIRVLKETIEAQHAKRIHKIQSILLQAQTRAQAAEIGAQLLEDQLSAKNETIKNLQQKNQTLENLKRLLLKKLDKMNEQIISISAKKSQNDFEHRESEKACESLSKESSVHAKSSVVSSIIEQQDLPQTLSEILQHEMKRRVSAVKRLYSFQQQRNQSFHNSIATHSNILLICHTEKDQLIGGFTSVGFPSTPPPQTTKAFLFGMLGEDITVSRLRSSRAKDSVKYDQDCLVFGDDQMCIMNGESLLTSNRDIMESKRCFQLPQRKDYLRDALGESYQTQLINYQIFEVKFAQ